VITEFDWLIAQGDTDFMEIEIVDEETNVPVDISGAVIYFTVKKSYSDIDSQAVIYKEITEHTDPINGKSRFDILSSDTNKPISKYLYDLIITFPTGERKHLIPPSNFTITPTVKEV